MSSEGVDLLPPDPVEFSQFTTPLRCRTPSPTCPSSSAAPPLRLPPWRFSRWRARATSTGRAVTNPPIASAAATLPAFWSPALVWVGLSTASWIWRTRSDSCYDSLSSQPTPTDDPLPLRRLLRPEDPPNQMGFPCRPVEER